MHICVINFIFFKWFEQRFRIYCAGTNSCYRNAGTFLKLTKPIFVDCEKTGNIDVDLIEKKLPKN